MQTQITSDLDAMQRQLSGMASVLRRPQAGVKAATRAVGNVLRTHFKQQNQKPNVRGWKKQGFWKQVRDSVQETFTETSGAVVVNDPRFLQKVFGGLIKAKTGKALAIPLKPEFYGVNPSTFPEDRFIFVKSKEGRSLGLLAEKQADGSLRLCYVLRTSVNQKADPSALPSLESLRAAGAKALNDQMGRELRAANPGLL